MAFANRGEGKKGKKINKNKIIDFFVSGVEKRYHLSKTSTFFREFTEIE